MAVFGAVISYFMQMVSFVLLRRKRPNIQRPYRSPLGTAGAIVAAVIAAVSLISLFFNADYRPGVVGVAIWFLAAIAYFAIVGRHRLVLSPEEEFAMTRRGARRPRDRGIREYPRRRRRRRASGLGAGRLVMVGADAQHVGRSHPEGDAGRRGAAGGRCFR